MATKIYVARETATVWDDSAGDLVLTFNNLAAAAVRIGARKDFGAGSTAEFYEWRCTVQFETAPVVGETVNLFLSTSDGTQPDGEMGAADAAGTVNATKNCNFIGAVVVTSTDAAHDMTASGVCRIDTRYVSPVVENATADNLKATANTSEFTLTPIPPESQ